MAINVSWAVVQKTEEVDETLGGQVSRMELRCGAKTQNCPDVGSSTTDEICALSLVWYHLPLGLIVLIRIERPSLPTYAWTTFQGKGLFSSFPKKCPAKLRSGVATQHFIAFSICHLHSEYSGIVLRAVGQLPTPPPT